MNLLTHTRKGTTRNGATTTLAYNDASHPLSESYAGGIQKGLSVTNGYDQYLRRTSLAALSGSAVASAAYSYDAASRLASVSDNYGNVVGYSLPIPPSWGKLPLRTAARRG